MSELPDGWTKKNLVACLEKIIDYRGKTPKKSVNGIVTLSAKSVKMGRIDYNQAYYISEETYKSFMVRGFPRKGDILMTTEAPLGCIAKLDRDNVSVAQRLLTLRGKAGVLDNDYLMYYLTSRIGQHELHARASGSTVQGIKRTEFEHVKVLLPPSFEEQETIAKILSSLDEKIELLREQNEVLKAIVQTIFKEFVIHENQDDWEDVTLDDISTRITDGSHLSPKTVEEGSPMASVKDMYQWGINYESCRKISKDDFSELVRTDCQPLKNDILIAKDGSYLKHIFLAEKDMDVVILSSIAIIRPNSKYAPLLLKVYLTLKSTKRSLENIVSGAVIPRIVLKDFRKFPLKLPPKEIQDKVLELIQPAHEKCLLNDKQIQTLIKSRNTLLPKLMSGEIRAEGFEQ